MVQTLFTIAPGLLRYLCAAFAIIYSYATLGMVLFSGAVSVEPEQNSAAVQQSAFGASDYYGNNFETMPRALVTLFEVLVVNNWHIIAAGYATATSSWAWVYFISFYFVGVIITINILVAFILEAFAIKMDQAESVEAEDQYDLLQAQEREFFASLCADGQENRDTGDSVDLCAHPSHLRQRAHTDSYSTRKLISNTELETQQTANLNRAESDTEISTPFDDLGFKSMKEYVHHVLWRLNASSLRHELENEQRGQECSQAKRGWAMPESDPITERYYQEYLTDSKSPQSVPNADPIILHRMLDT